MTYVAGAPGHVDDKDGDAKQEQDDGEDKDHPRTQGEVHLQTQGCNSCTKAVRGRCCGPMEQFNNGYQDLCHSCHFQTSTKDTFLLHCIFV